MLVCTGRAEYSKGDSTDMHSFDGKETIYEHLPFVDVHRKVPVIKVKQEVARHNQIAEFMSYVPECLESEHTVPYINREFLQTAYNTQQKVETEKRNRIKLISDNRDEQGRQSHLSSISENEESREKLKTAKEAAAEGEEEGSEEDEKPEPPQGPRIKRIAG